MLKVVPQINNKNMNTPTEDLGPLSPIITLFLHKVFTRVNITEVVDHQNFKKKNTLSINLYLAAMGSSGESNQIHWEVKDHV